MPVPWGKTHLSSPGPDWSAVKEIPDAQNRAISLRQLKELRDYCQRLCKAGLLKQQDGKRVKWTQLTQHEICDLVIKKIIPPENSCSWVEVVAQGQAQERVFFCSHHWGECFRDFMVSIEAHAKSEGVGLEQKYWICVYANNQHNVVLGKTLKESPFYEALKHSRRTLLMLDKTADALLRLWCVFELYETLVTLKQKLELWTPLGRVGSGLVSSGPVVQALNRIDTCRAQASNAVDQRQILNYIAGVEEADGIVLLPNGGKALLEEPPEFKLGLYERELIQKHTCEFQALNGAISRSVRSVIEDLDTSTTVTPRREYLCKSLTPQRSHFRDEMEPKCVVPDGCMRGVTLQQLRDFHQKVRFDFENHPEGIEVKDKLRKYSSADMYTIEKLYLQRQRQSSGYSYMEMISEKEHRPEYHIIYGSFMQFKDFMAAIEWHAEARHLPDSAVYYFVPFMMDDDTSPREKGTKYTRHDGPPTKEVLERHAIGVVMLIDSEASVLERCIPAWEAHLGISRGLCFDLAAASGALATTKPFANGAWEFGDFEAALASKALEFDVARTKTQKMEDMKRYLGEIAGGNWDDEKMAPDVVDNYPFWRLNMRLRQKVAGPVLREAGYEGSIEMVQKVLIACPNMSFQNESLKGTLGETAVHTAAASGHTEVVKLLVILKAAVDATDSMGETPLHYAALAGQVPAVKQLIAMSADTELESFDAETPLTVARLNPAYYIVPDAQMEAVRKVLHEEREVVQDAHLKIHFSRAEMDAPAILLDSVNQLKYENWRLRKDLVTLSKESATNLRELEAKNEALSEENRRLQLEKSQLSGRPADTLQRINRMLAASSLKVMAPDALAVLLSQVAGLEEGECKQLVLAAHQALDAGPPGSELDLGRFMDWLMGAADSPQCSNTAS